MLFEGISVRRWANIDNIALRKLAVLNRAATLDDLRIPPNKKLEKLCGDRKGLCSIRINDQFRLCFSWSDGHAFDVAIVDYH